MWGQQLHYVTGSQTIPSFKSVQLNLKITSKLNIKLVDSSQDWGNVMSSFKTRKKPSCCILNWLEEEE